MFNLIKQPEEISWSGNSIIYTFVCAPYRVQDDVRLEVKIQVEDIKYSEAFRDIKTEILTPGLDGIVNFDIKIFTGSFLEFTIPEVNRMAAQLSVEQCKRFRVVYRSIFSGVYSTEIISTPIFVLKGGLPYDGDRTFDFYSSLVDENFFYLGTDHMLHQEGLIFATFLYLGVALELPEFHCIATLENNDSLTKHAIPFKLRKGDVFHVPITRLAQLNVGATVYKIRIEFLSDSDEVIGIKEFNFQQNIAQKVTDILFVNSSGGIDSLRLFGEENPGLEMKQSFTNSAKAGKVNKSSLPANILETDFASTATNSLNTGYLLKTDEPILNSLMHAILIFQLEDLRYKSVFAVKKNFNFSGSSDFIYAAQIELRERFEQKFFSQYSQGKFTPGACPALTALTVSQENSSTLRVNWSCPNPYRDVEIVMIAGSPAVETRFEFIGGTGTELIRLIPGQTGTVTVKGRLKCGENTTIEGIVLPDYGPYTTHVIELFLNISPRAVDDTFQIQKGFTTVQAMPGNVLANDYDPDGDEIECEPASGITLQGGSYTVSVDGRIFYRPPSANFTGLDTFKYKVREVDNPASFSLGNVFIDVVAGAVTETVYAKLLFINRTQNGPDVKADVVVQTFENSLCTIAKDVTSMGISFNVNLNTILKNLNTSTEVSNIDTQLHTFARGVQTTIASGVFLARGYRDGVNMMYEVFTYKLLPGNGYIIV